MTLTDAQSAQAEKFMLIANALGDDPDDMRRGEYIRDFFADVDADIERHDWDELEEALAIRQAQSVLWDMARHGHIAAFNMGVHPRWQRWSTTDRSELNRSIRGELPVT